MWKVFNNYFVSKKKYNLLEKRFESTNKSQAANLKVKFFFENLCCILNDDKNLNLSEIYVIDDIPYGLFFKISHDSIWLYTYNLNFIKHLVCRSDSEFCNKKLEILNIDSAETRKGHASKHIEFYKQICRTNNISIIFGMLWTATPIGIDNLKKFYMQNGFIVSNTKFKLHIED